MGVCSISNYVLILVIEKNVKWSQHLQRLLQFPNENKVVVASIVMYNI